MNDSKNIFLKLGIAFFPLKWLAIFPYILAIIWDILKNGVLRHLENTSKEDVDWVKVSKDALREPINLFIRAGVQNDV